MNTFCWPFAKKEKIDNAINVWLDCSFNIWSIFQNGTDQRNIEKKESALVWFLILLLFVDSVSFICSGLFVWDSLWTWKCYWLFEYYIHIPKCPKAFIQSIPCCLQLQLDKMKSTFDTCYREIHFCWLISICVYAIVCMMNRHQSSSSHLWCGNNKYSL